MGARDASEIVSYFAKDKTDSSAIPKSNVIQWIASDDPEVMGAAYQLLVDATLANRIAPTPSFDEIFEFFLRYYEFCLRRDPQGEWVDNRFTAGCELVRVFVSYWNKGIDEKYFVSMKSLLRRLYLEGSPDYGRRLCKRLSSTSSKMNRFADSSPTGAIVLSFARHTMRGANGLQGAFAGQSKIKRRPGSERRNRLEPLERRRGGWLTHLAFLP